MKFDLRRHVRSTRELLDDSLLVGRKIDLEVVDEPEVPLVAEVERLADDAPAAEVGRL